MSTVVCEILQSRDFRVSEKDGYLHASKGNSEVVFCVLESLDDEAVEDFMTRYRDHPGKRVLAVLEPVPSSMLEAMDRSVVVWDREVLEHEIGRTRIEKVVGDKDHGMVDELVADDFPRMVSPEALDSVGEAAVGERIVRPVLGVEDVREISERAVEAFNYRLELVPHFVYSYVCPLYSGGRKVSVERGTLSVNGLTGKVEKWNERTDVVYALENVHRRLEPSILAQEAEDLAKKELVRVHSFQRERVHEDESITITERTTVSPREKEIALEDRGTYYIPIWCVEGAHGIMIINAGTGEIVTEDRCRL